MNGPQKIRGLDLVSHLGRLQGMVRQTTAIFAVMCAAMFVSARLDLLLVAVGVMVAGGCYAATVSLTPGSLPFERTAWRTIALWFIAQGSIVAALVFLDNSLRYVDDLVWILALVNLSASTVGVVFSWRLSGMNVRLQGWLEERHREPPNDPAPTS